jgi:glycosyltransferase involved in cell wall biosynthesis
MPVVMPKQVLMTADTVGGVWTYALELATALGDWGLEVALATMGTLLTPQQREVSEQIPNLEVFESDFKLEWMEDPWDDVSKAGEWLLQLEKRLQPDIVHLNGYVHAALPWQAPTLVVGHSCVLSWWEAVKGEVAPSNWDRYRQAVRQGLQAANLAIAPSTAMLAALKQHYGSFVNSKVIFNGRDSAAFYPAEKEEFVLTAGRLWDEAKNIAALECVAPQLLWSIYVAGEDKHPSRDRDWTGGNCSLVQLGHLSAKELASWYARAAIYALPARYEPFGLSVLEAALSGCALVLGDIASLREIWEDAAVFVPPDDKEAIASVLNTLISDFSLRTALASRAYTRALEFTSRRMVAGYLQAYQDLIG